MFFEIKRCFTTFIGAGIIALSLDLFLIPADIAPGGISGLSIIINHLFGIPVGVMILLLNLPIFILALRYFDYKFLILSIFGMLVLSISTDILSFIKPVTKDLILSAVYGGVLLGLGVGIVIRSGTTTGGTEIIAYVLKKHFPRFSVGKFILFIDAIIVVLAGTIYNRWEVTLYSAAALYVSSLVVDAIVEGVDFAKLVYVISDKSKEITDEISSRMFRGTTALSASSLYTGVNKTALMCVVKKYEIEKLKKIIKQVDATAFVIVADAREVLGNGFKKI